MALECDALRGRCRGICGKNAFTESVDWRAAKYGLQRHGLFCLLGVVGRVSDRKGRSRWFDSKSRLHALKQGEHESNNTHQPISPHEHGWDGCLQDVSSNGEQLRVGVTLPSRVTGWAKAARNEFFFLDLPPSPMRSSVCCHPKSSATRQKQVPRRGPLATSCRAVGCGCLFVRREGRTVPALVVMV